MKIRPLNDQVVVRPDPVETVSKGGIHLPDNVKEKPVRGVVVAIGPGERYGNYGDRYACSVSAGDQVIYNSRYAGNEITLEGETVRIMSEKEILAVIPK